MQHATRQLLNLTSLSDQELISLVRGRDNSAFGIIMRRYNRSLYRAARRLVRNHSDAEDVLQESDMRAFIALSKFRGDSSLGTWLTRIVKNEALARIRRERSAERLNLLDQSVSSSVALLRKLDPEASAALAEVRHALERAMDDLPDAFRSVFIMRAVEGLSVRETAVKLSIREATVKTRLHRARVLLRVALGQTLASSLTETFPFEHMWGELPLRSEAMT